ncbi:MAG: arginine--tRNA ligase, partial [Phycisphaerae bacterium]|nr:arginine--tRNA ligase [Phycisphaerae bacterium]
MNLRRELDGRLTEALSEVCGREAPALVAPASRPQFGDYQANGVMAAAKMLKADPRELAQKVLAAADLSDLAGKVEIAGAGFINITLKCDWVSAQLTERLGDERLGVNVPANPQTVVVDYSHPNIAKEMHVGHLRSTVIGDALVRVLDFLGHKVIRQNHIGDWGTQFGMVLAHLDEVKPDADVLSDLDAFYQQAQQRFDSDAQFADNARHYVVRLQSGDRKVMQSWEKFIDHSLRHCEQVYEKLSVTLTRGDVRGESAYNDDLPSVVADLDKAGLLTESQGAKCVFL